MRQSYPRFGAQVIRGPATTTFSREFHAGKWVRIAPGYYVAIQDWLDAGYEGRYLMTVAAVVLKDPSRVLCEETALYLMGQGGATPREVMVLASSPYRMGRRPPAFRVHGEGPDQERARDLPAPRIRDRHYEDRGALPLEKCEGITCTSREYSLARVLLHSDGKMAMAAADAFCVDAGLKNLDEATEVRELIERHRYKLQVRRALRIMELATNTSESVLESFSKWVIACLGFPVPEQQVWLYDREGRIGRVDYRWRKYRVTGESDGVAKDVDFEGTRQERVLRTKAQRRREERLVALGPVVHWGMDEIYRPQQLRQKLLRVGLPQDRKSMMNI